MNYCNLDTDIVDYISMYIYDLSHTLKNADKTEENVCFQ